jgi:hypothetical protein
MALILLINYESLWSSLLKMFSRYWNRNCLLLVPLFSGYIILVLVSNQPRYMFNLGRRGDELSLGNCEAFFEGDNIESLVRCLLT